MASRRWFEWFRPRSNWHPSPGSARSADVSAGRRQTGFTLVELLVVLVMIGISVALVSLALRDPSAARLEQEGARLAALLEAGRAEARALGLPVRFELGSNVPGEGFHFVGLPPQIKLPQRWLNEDMQADIVGARALVLGPEPLIGPQRINLRLGDQRLMLATDGLGPFTAQSETLPGTP